MPLIELQTPLSKSECEKRLRERIHGPLETYSSVYGKVSGPEFWIEQRTGYRNSFKTRLRGDVVQRPDGVLIRCRVGLPPILFACIAAWFVILSLATFFIWLIQFKVPAALPVMLAASGALFAFGRFAAKDESENLVRFICENLQAASCGSSKG